MGGPGKGKKEFYTGKTVIWIVCCGGAQCLQAPNANWKSFREPASRLLMTLFLLRGSGCRDGPFPFPVGIHKILEYAYGGLCPLPRGRDYLFETPFHIPGGVNTRDIGSVV